MGQSDQISVLLVEDDEAARTTIAAILTAAGMTVEQTADGPTGLNRAGSGGHDVVILDRMLPHLSVRKESQHAAYWEDAPNFDCVAS